MKRTVASVLGLAILLMPVCMVSAASVFDMTDTGYRAELDESNEMGANEREHELETVESGGGTLTAEENAIPLGDDFFDEFHKGN